MWHNDINYLFRLQADYHKELLRQAQDHRLARLAVGNRVRFTHLYIQPLLRLGRWMIIQGQNLVQRFEIESADISAFSLPSTK